jgi:hypothetical protein
MGEDRGETKQWALDVLNTHRGLLPLGMLYVASCCAAMHVGLLNGIFFTMVVTRDSTSQMLKKKKQKKKHVRVYNLEADKNTDRWSWMPFVPVGCQETSGTR